jgi:biotin carboxylase
MSESNSAGKKAPRKRERILLIGRRKSAIAAAKRLGWKPVVIDVHSRLEQAPHAFGGTRKWAVEAAEEFFPDSPPLSVAAVATGSVVAAAAIREHFGLPGLPLEVARRCHDKLVMKKAIVAAGIPCAPWRETNASTTAEELIDELGMPVVLKMPISSGGRGVWVCGSKEEVAAHLRAGLLAEGFVRGTEMSVESFRHGGRTVFRNHTRYLKPRWANVVPAELDEDVAAWVNALAERVHEGLGIASGISHMEVFLGEEGPVFGEIAARPPGGYLMELMRRAYEFDPWESLLRLEAGEAPNFPAEAKRHAGVWLIHPGPGTVRAVLGTAEALTLPGVVEVSCVLQPGDRVVDRVGSGESKGHIFAEALSAGACGEVLRRAVERVQVAMEAG